KTQDGGVAGEVYRRIDIDGKTPELLRRILDDNGATGQRDVLVGDRIGWCAQDNKLRRPINASSEGNVRSVDHSAVELIQCGGAVDPECARDNVRAAGLDEGIGPNKPQRPRHSGTPTP